jgi:hypothetical protein
MKSANLISCSTISNDVEMTPLRPTDAQQYNIIQWSQYLMYDSYSLTITTVHHEIIHKIVKKMLHKLIKKDFSIQSLFLNEYIIIIYYF